jgi:hypothetical protein
MRTQSIEVGHVKATRKGSIRYASVCPDRASKVQHRKLSALVVLVEAGAV